MKKINIRKRIIISAFLNAILIFFVFSPISSEVESIIYGPDVVTEVNAIQTPINIALEWSSVDRVTEYGIQINERNLFFEDDRTTYVVEKEDGIDDYQIRIITKDFYGNEKFTDLLSISYPLGESTKQFEITEETSSFTEVFNFLSVRLPLTLSALLISTFWVLLFRLSNVRVFFLGLYPSVLLIPFLLLLLSIFFQQENIGFLLGLILSTIIGISYYVILYFTFLTINILNNSLQYTLPLAQAAKAVQFIFSLISTYVLFTLIYSSSTSPVENAGLIVPFVFFFTFSSNMLIENLPLQRVLTRSFAISIVLSFASFTFSMWPVDTVYVILASAVLYYIALSVSLEFKQAIHKYSTAEYSALVLLIFIIFVLNSDWGIIGSVI